MSSASGPDVQRMNSLRSSAGETSPPPSWPPFTSAQKPSFSNSASYTSAAGRRTRSSVPLWTSCHCPSGAASTKTYPGAEAPMLHHRLRRWANRFLWRSIVGIELDRLARRVFVEAYHDKWLEGKQLWNSTHARALVMTLRGEHPRRCMQASASHHGATKHLNWTHRPDTRAGASSEFLGMRPNTN